MRRYDACRFSCRKNPPSLFSLMTLSHFPKAPVVGKEAKHRLFSPMWALKNMLHWPRPPETLVLSTLGVNLSLYVTLTHVSGLDFTQGLVKRE